MKENGYAYQTINNYKRSLIASFYTAMEDDYVRGNPFNYLLNTVVALTEEQEEKLLAFAENDRVYHKYYDVILLLLKTGLRASEMCGLTINDLDFENRFINVDHQLMRYKEIGYYIETPKTKSGIRKIPMSEEAYQSLQRILAKRKKAQPIVIDGYSDFLFLNQEGYPIIGAYYTVTFGNLVKKYNKSHEDKLPKITPHIMGHSNINITMNLYAHASIDGVKSEMISLIA